MGLYGIEPVQKPAHFAFRTSNCHPKSSICHFAHSICHSAFFLSFQGTFLFCHFERSEESPSKRVDPSLSLGVTEKECHASPKRSVVPNKVIGL